MDTDLYNCYQQKLNNNAMNYIRRLEADLKKPRWKFTIRKGR